MLSPRCSENRRELADTLYLFVLQGVNKLFPLIVLPYLMAVLGATGYGYVGFALSVVQYAVLVVDFGFDLSATKQIALVRTDQVERTRVFWAVFWAKTWLLLLSFGLILLLVAFVPAFRAYTTAVLCTLPMAVGSAYTFMWMFQGMGQVRVMAVLNTLSKLLLLPVIFFVVKTPADYPLAALLQSLVFVLTAVVSGLWLWLHRVVGRMSYEPAVILSSTRESLPLFLSRASTSVYTQLFVVLLGFMCAADAIGRYTSAEALMRALCFVVCVPLTQAFFPRIAALSKSDRPQALRAFRLVRRLVVLTMLAVSLGIFFGAPIATRLLGPSYSGLDTLLRILSLAPLCIGLGAVYGQMGLVALGNAETRKQFRNVYFITAVVALVSVALLAPFFKERGAAVALVVSEATVAVLMGAAYYRQKRRDAEPAPDTLTSETHS